ncbi:MAG: AAA family ATPase [Sphingomonadales bacterium]|nr:AAA family ATPase [Sphingomonadales bacterium]MBD3772095.1 AAA family ATPase [Paracoccaceae bacterium]
MNDPAAQPVDIEEQRQWLIDHKASSGASWGTLAKRLNIALGTLSQFGSQRGYAGNEQALADKIFRYRQTLAAQKSLRVEAPEIPGYFETETSAQLIHMLHWAQRGRIVTAAMGAGLGKSTTAKHFQACNSNVFMATMTPSTSGMFGMQRAVLRALGMMNCTGMTQVLSERVIKLVSDLDSPLLIVDEAQHLSERALEEMRSWHDQTGLGIALFGNESVQQRLEGNRSAVYAQLFSRQSLKLVRSMPLTADIDALIDAWRVRDEAACNFVHQIAKKPGALRGATFTIELASMLAMASHEELAVEHLQDAWAQLSARAVLS